MGFLSSLPQSCWAGSAPLFSSISWGHELASDSGISGFLTDPEPFGRAASCWVTPYGHLGRASAPTVNHQAGIFLKAPPVVHAWPQTLTEPDSGEGQQMPWDHSEPWTSQLGTETQSLGLGRPCVLMTGTKGACQPGSCSLGPSGPVKVGVGAKSRASGTH